MRIGVSGHQQIPSEAVAHVKERMTRLLSAAKDDLVGVSSLAAGADQLFVTAVLENGGRLHAIIPCQQYETTFGDKSDLERFVLLLGRADKVEVLNHCGPSEEAFLDAGHRVVENSDLLVAVWDGKPARGLGGTADTVDYARRRGTTVEVIWPEGLIR